MKATRRTLTKRCTLMACEVVKLLKWSQSSTCQRSHRPSTSNFPVLSANGKITYVQQTYLEKRRNITATPSRVQRIKHKMKLASSWPNVNEKIPKARSQRATLNCCLLARQVKLQLADKLYLTFPVRTSLLHLIVYLSWAIAHQPPHPTIDRKLHQICKDKVQLWTANSNE